jgi:hypothetical protein
MKTSVTNPPVQDKCRTRRRATCRTRQAPKETDRSLRLPRDRHKCDCSRGFCGGCVADCTGCRLPTGPYHQYCAGRAALGFCPSADSLLVCERVPHLMLTVEQSPNQIGEASCRPPPGTTPGKTLGTPPNRTGKASCQANSRAATGDASNETPKRHERADGQPPGTR